MLPTNPTCVGLSDRLGPTGFNRPQFPRKLPHECCMPPFLGVPHYTTTGKARQRTRQWIMQAKQKHMEWLAPKAAENVMSCLSIAFALSHRTNNSFTVLLTFTCKALGVL